MKYLLNLFMIFFIVCNTTAIGQDLPKIKDKKGDVLYKSQTTSWSNAQTDQILALQDSVKTSKESYVDVEFDMVNLFRLKAMSEIIVENLPEESQKNGSSERLYSFNLLSGNIVAKLKKLPEKTRFEIQTPVAIAGARGTAFSVSASTKKSDIVVMENKVSIISRENIHKSVVSEAYKKVTIAPWKIAGLTESGTGILSEAILGKMIRDSVDKIVIRAKGIGNLHPEIAVAEAAKQVSLREARIDAENRLADIISEIKVGPEKNMADLMFGNSSLTGKLFEMVSNAYVIETEKLPDGRQSVLIEIRIDTIQQLVKQKINAWKSIKQISRAQYMQDYPALARITTERAAKLDAYRRLAERIYGTVITSETTVKDLTLKNDVIVNEVKGLVKGATITNTTYFSDGSVKVTAAIDGSLVKAGLEKVSGEDFGENYMSSPKGIKYKEYQLFSILKQMK